MIDDATVRELALAFPETVEMDHFGHPSFRVRGKIFATLRPEEGRAMVKLPLPDQATFCAAYPAMFAPVPGGWGRQGSTHVSLQTVTRAIMREALALAWLRAAPKGLAANYMPTREGDAEEGNTSQREANGVGVTLDQLRQIALAFPDVVEGTSYGTPGFRVRNAFLGRLWEDGATLVLKIGEMEREPLLALDPDIYFLTDHYVPSPCVLVRMPRIHPDELRRVFAIAWRRAAPKRLVAAHAGKLPGNETEPDVG